MRIDLNLELEVLQGQVQTEPVYEHLGAMRPAFPLDAKARCLVARSQPPKFQDSSRSPVLLPRDARGINQFIAALNLAYQCHLGLALSPDHLWTLILGGVAKFMTLPCNSDKFRGVWVAHSGKIELKVRDDRLKRNVVTPAQNHFWAESLPGYEALLRPHLEATGMADAVLQSFSTSTPISRMVHLTQLMDMNQAFFSYTMQTMCGFRFIDLQGSISDWEKLVPATEHLLGKFGEDLAWWSVPLLDCLRRIVDCLRLPAAPETKAFWNSLYKMRNSSGGPFVTGWCNNLFPFISRNRKNEMVDMAEELESEHGNIAGDNCDNAFPLVQGQAPISWDYHGEIIPTTLSAGFANPTLDSSTGVIHCELAWQISENL